MIINKKQIKEEIKTNLENMKKINSLEEYIKYDTSLCHLIDIYEILSSSVSLYRIPRNKNYELQEIGKFDYLSILLEEFKRNNEIHKEYSKRIIDIYSKIDLKNLSIPKTKLKKEDRIDIIRDFLNSYDSNMYELFMNMDGYIDMDTKKLKINIPEGYEIDKENSTFEEIVFKKVEDPFAKLPKTWEEYCKQTKDYVSYFWSNHDSIIKSGFDGYYNEFLTKKD